VEFGWNGAHGWLGLQEQHDRKILFVIAKSWEDSGRKDA
jgi:hypothetical protein